MSSGIAYKTQDVTFLEDLYNLKSNLDPKIFQKRKSELFSIFMSRFLKAYKNKELEILKDQYFNIVKNINSFLSNCTELSNQQKLNYCTIERYFMKLYLREFASNSE